MASKYELKTSKNGQFVFNLKAANGQVILTSESYTTKDAALNGIESVRKNSQVDTNFERKTATNNQPYFTLKAANGQTIGKSELYSGTAAMENGIASVKTNASGASVEEVT
ncbi:MAG: YegP family protein [Opitutaceae bacterium]|nr:YegP family protein [Opitutaceae bacterium]